MFTEVEIALVDGEIALDTDGIEYEIIKEADANSLVIDQLLKQLKVSRVEYAYFFDKSEIIFLKKINPILEKLDSTNRFNFKKKSIFNLKDIYLLNKLLAVFNSSSTSCDIYIKWDKKIEYFFDVNSADFQIGELNESVWSYVLAMPDERVLDQRFSVLLNDTFLNKLKTYVALWKQTNNIVYHLPEWYQKLYKTKT